MEDDPYWCDRLVEKHECFGYREVKKTALKVGGKNIELLLPDYYPKMTPLEAVIKGDLLFVVGKQKQTWAGEGPLGAVIIAHRESKNQFSAVMWHETYPWALQYMGLVPKKKRKKVEPKGKAK